MKRKPVKLKASSWEDWEKKTHIITIGNKRVTSPQIL